MTRTARDEMSLSTVFDVLSHSCRRRILLELADHNPRTEDEFEAEEFATDGDDSIRSELNSTTFICQRL
jgi:hypothetical protein